ncbi:MAG: hypothetical protein ACO1SV_22190 [Fimbriimonas sp.]
MATLLLRIRKALLPMEADLPQELFEAREALWEDIHTAFAGVDRQGGTSWSDAVLESGAYSTEACIRASHFDDIHDWRELIESRP